MDKIGNFCNVDLSIILNSEKPESKTVMTELKKNFSLILKNLQDKLGVSSVLRISVANMSFSNQAGSIGPGINGGYLKSEIVN